MADHPVQNPEFYGQRLKVNKMPDRSGPVAGNEAGQSSYKPGVKVSGNKMDYSYQMLHFDDPPASSQFGWRSRFLPKTYFLNREFTILGPLCSVIPLWLS